MRRHACSCTCLEHVRPADMTQLENRGLPDSAAFPRLSDARWARLWALIQEHDRPPAPYTSDEEARRLLLALLYRALTDAAWDALPNWAPPAAVVQDTYDRWYRLGLLQRLTDVLLIDLDSDTCDQP